ncbi:MAG: glucuronate isomerase [Planctomycetota bacterium]
MTFIHDDFLLSGSAAKRLYHDYAADQPIIDYHNHLSPQAIAENKPFENLHDMWVDGDHYKWRAMRANGIDEALITGDASPQEKFLAFARTVPKTIRNPLYHWTHLELSRFFGIDELLSEDNAGSIWHRCNELIASADRLRPRGILEAFQVTALCTTDDPTDDLKFHQQIAADGTLKTKVYPAFRPDWALFVDRPDEFNPWIEKLATMTGISIQSVDDLLSALKQRHDFFHQLGGRLSDHGCQFVPASFGTDGEANDIFLSARNGAPATTGELDQFSTWMLLELAKLDHEKDWTNQFHTGVWRNNNSRLFKTIGRDIGCDSMGDTPQGRSLGRFLDRLEQTNQLPKTIVYNLNPSDNYLIATMLGNFQGGNIASKMQFGSGWWYLDQKEGMEWQMNTLSNTGLISRFIGMLTDSRSFMSFTRHEYFRRVLCNLFGRDMESGDLPDDFELVGNTIADICYRNARAFLGLEGS